MGRKAGGPYPGQATQQAADGGDGRRDGVVGMRLLGDPRRFSVPGTRWDSQVIWLCAYSLISYLKETRSLVR